MNPVAYKGNGIIQVMSSAEIVNLAANVLEYMASVNTGVGVISSNVSANANIIGTFEDITLQNDSGNPGIDIISQTFVLYQELSNGAIPESDPPGMVGYDTSSSSLRSLSTTEYNDIATVILDYCVTQDGPFSYVLANTAPVSGTWAIRGTLAERANSTLSGNVVHLYQKIANNAYTYNRPLKATGSNLQRFTNQEIKNIAKKVRQRILATGIGEYKFQELSPTVGTWVQEGSIVDVKYSTITNSFDGATFTGIFDGAAFTQTYTGTVNYTGNYVGTVPANYTGPAVYVGPINPANPGFTGFVGSATFTGTTPATFTGTYTEATTSTIDYIATFTSDYISTYESVAVGSTTETVKTYYLWRRIA